MTELTPGLVGRDAAERLASIAASVPDDQAVIEIGVFLAKTTVVLAAGARSGHGAHVYGVDPWDLPGQRAPYKWLHHPRKGKTRQLFTQPATRERAEAAVADLDDVTLIQGFGADVGHEWTGPPIGLLLIDGDHRAEHVRADWDAWSPHLAPNAVVAWDDYHADYDGVVEVVDSLVSDATIEIVEVIDRGASAMALTRVHP